MTPLFDLGVETRGGVCDLSRVVGVLALYELTPARLAVEPLGEGLKIKVRIEADDRASRLCANRMAALPSVAAVCLRRHRGRRSP